jgi:hypothetical protein
MANEIDRLFQGDPAEWIQAVPSYHRASIDELLKQGKNYQDIADLLLTARAEHTYTFGSTQPQKDKNVFFQNLLQEIENFLCGDSKYETERTKLFGEQGLARTYVVSAISVAIAPYLGVSAVVLSPAVALILASMGKITLNAWCQSRREARANKET